MRYCGIYTFFCAVLRFSDPPYAPLSFGCVMTFIRCTVNFAFGLLDCIRYIGDFVIPGPMISGFYFTHFTVTLSRLQNIVLHSEDFFMSGFHCSYTGSSSIAYHGVNSKRYMTHNFLKTFLNENGRMGVDEG